MTDEQTRRVGRLRIECPDGRFTSARVTVVPDRGSAPFDPVELPVQTVGFRIGVNDFSHGGVTVTKLQVAVGSKGLSSEVRQALTALLEADASLAELPEDMRTAATRGPAGQIAYSTALAAAAAGEDVLVLTDHVDPHQARLEFRKWLDDYAPAIDDLKRTRDVTVVVSRLMLHVSGTGQTSEGRVMFRSVRNAEVLQGLAPTIVVNAHLATVGQLATSLIKRVERDSDGAPLRDVQRV